MKNIIKYINTSLIITFILFGALESISATNTEKQSVVKIKEIISIESMDLKSVMVYH